VREGDIVDNELEIDWLKAWSRYSPLAVAFKDAESGTEYSYSALYYLSCKIATHLSERFDIKTGDRVACLATTEFEYVPLFFAIQRLGAILVPINFRLTGREVAHILEDSAPELLIFQNEFESVLEAAGAKVVPEKNWHFDGKSSLTAFVALETAHFEQEKISQTFRFSEPTWAFEMRGEFESPCKILYTSGTTGAPKGAVVTNKMLYWNSINTTLRLNISQNDVAVGFLPFFHTGAWNVLLTPFIHRGARTILLKKFDPERVLEICEKERVTVLFGVPTTMDMMTHTKLFQKADLSSVRYAVVGGEPMPIELIKAWEHKGVPIRQGYGLTEFGPNVFSLNEEDSIRKIGSIGFPNFYIQARVIDDSGQELPPNAIGELVLKGPVCMAGYWRNEEATSNTVIDGWLHTSDLVKRDEEGYYYVAGRKKDMFKSGGENVYPVEIERVISAHVAVREVAVIGVADSKWGEVGKAFIALKSGCELTADELLSFCQKNLAKFKIPKHVEFLADLPKGDSGKILKRKLKDN
jgi:fatty-acyl-CoA synthase